ncbi:MAG: methionyl-tRNA formyltransferase [Candidatus Thioglobus sp.]|nr:methionyl-tRNA formyltransferase [Candidatus Thioglobus sp.]
MKIVFAGSTDFSLEILSALKNSGHQIIGVFCQPDRPAGRGKILSACPVKVAALEHNFDVFQPESFDANAQKNLSNLSPEVMIVAAFGQILPEAILQIPKYGCLNIHTSKLPRWRGAAPIQRAILAGDKTTGISIMQMDSGLDTGNILLQKTCNISNFDTAKSLQNKLAILGGEALIKVLENINNLTKTPQSAAGITYAKKLSKSEAWIDWGKSAVEIDGQIRAFNPYPIAQTSASSDKFEKAVLRIFASKVMENNTNSQPGEIIQFDKKNCIIATGNGSLGLEKVQLAGKNPQSIQDFNNGHRLTRLFSD